MRAFIAIDFDDKIREALGRIQDRLKKGCPPLKWVRPEQLHLTLKFLGEISDRQVVGVAEALGALCRECHPIDIIIGGIGVFPPSGAVRVVWAGIEDPDGELADCQARCDRLLEALGFPREKRRFSPHLTLGRVKDIAAGRQIRQALAREQASRIGAQTIDHLTFYQSTLGPAGPKYDVLSRHRFG